MVRSSRSIGKYINYIINNKNNNKYLPKVEYWIMDDLNLKVLDALLYKMILQKKYCLWTYDYIAKLLRVSRSSVHRMLKKLITNKIIQCKTIYVNSENSPRERCIYTESGKRSPIEINNYMEQGENELKKMYNQKRYYKKHK